MFAKFGGSPWWNGDPFARTPRRFTTGRPSSAYRLLSHQLRDYGVDVPYIQAHIHGLSSRSVLYLDDSLTVLRDEEVDGPVSVVVSFPCVLYSRPGIALAGGLTRRIEVAGRRCDDLLSGWTETVRSIVTTGCLLVVLLDNGLTAPWIRPDLPGRPRRFTGGCATAINSPDKAEVRIMAHWGAGTEMFTSTRKPTWMSGTGRGLPAGSFYALRERHFPACLNCLAGAVVMAEGVLPGAVLAAVEVARPVIRRLVIGQVQADDPDAWNAA